MIFEGYGSRMAADDFDRKGGTAGFAVTGGIKDVSHMQTLAAEKKVGVFGSSNRHHPILQ
jgi:hypothetical protein